MFIIEMNELKQGFRNYIAIDDQISAMESKIADMRKERDRVEKGLLSIIEKNNLQKKEIKIGNSRFQYSVSDRKDGFTQQYVKQALTDYFGFYYDGKMSREKCNEKSDHVFQYLLANRTVKHKVALKRMAEKPVVGDINTDTRSINSVRTIGSNNMAPSNTRDPSFYRTIE